MYAATVHDVTPCINTTFSHGSKATENSENYCVRSMFNL